MNDEVPKYPKWFVHWLGNHWRHATWKLNGLIAGFVVLVGLVVAILCAILTVVYD